MSDISYIKDIRYFHTAIWNINNKCDNIQSCAARFQPIMRQQYNADKRSRHKWHGIPNTTHMCCKKLTRDSVNVKKITEMEGLLQFIVLDEQLLTTAENEGFHHLIEHGTA